jgi:adenine-specific DNA-methyltransferase
MHHMPSLQWLGKDKVVNYHHDVPFKPLIRQYTFGAGNQAQPIVNENRIVHGDNLEALKALLPEFEGQVNFIYIDPPYNTGNEGWVYNDNMNDVHIVRWVGKVVGKEGDDLSRHDKWLCMMYPRLKMLWRLLTDGGIVAISIDDNEAASLRLLLDEIFGGRNFVANIVWQKRYVANVTAKFLSDMHDHVLIYAKSKQSAVINKPVKTQEQRNAYRNPDNDPRGPWRAQDLSASKPYSEGIFEIKTPFGER